MKSPFPGMDPYLEYHWRDVHASLIIYARDQLQSQLPGGLRSRVEERVFVESDESHSMYPDLRVFERRPESPETPGKPLGVAVAEPIIVHADVEPLSQTYIEILDVGTGNRVVTVIEFSVRQTSCPGREGSCIFANSANAWRAGYR